MFLLDIDTKGRIYPRALQQVFVGLYVAEACLVGLFAIASGTSVGAVGPLILMVIMLVVTALYQAALNSALGPLLDYLPKSMDAEERRLLAEENGDDLENGNHAYGEGSKEGGKVDARARATTGNNAPPHKKPNMFTKWLRPDIYTDYATMRRLVPKDIPIQYAPEVEAEAYYNPSITSRTPLLWVPRDPVGVSRQECAQTSKVIPMTDDGAYLDEKNKVVWDAQDGRPPIYEEKIYY